VGVSYEAVQATVRRGVVNKALAAGRSVTRCTLSRINMEIHNVITDGIQLRTRMRCADSWPFWHRASLLPSWRVVDAGEQHKLKMLSNL
jgi:hypothetical protein